MFTKFSQDNQSSSGFIWLWNQGYTFDATTGNLTGRSNNLLGLSETFGYDNLDRLTTGVNYLPSGNINSKSDVGDYAYDSNKPHAVAAINNPSTAIPFVQQDITYTAFNKVDKITEGDYEADFTYGPDYQRRKSILKLSGAAQKTVIYDGNYEKITVGNSTYQVHYIAGSDGLAAMYVIPPSGGGGALYYVNTDHLGSINLIYDADGNKVYEQNFDAWGRERNPDDWTYTANTQTKPEWLIRGYTDHEHLPELGLINMNGRVYDPLLGRMLSPDNFVQAADATQAYNRYAYAGNNPLKFTDPSGDNPIVVAMIIGAAMGAYSGGVIANEGQYNPTKWDYSSGKTWGYMLGGAIVGAASGYIGGAVATSGMPMANTAGIMAGSFVNSIGTHIYTGGQTDVSISFGVASYNFDQNEWGYLGKKGNKWYENVGYGLGALANVADVLAGFKPGSVELRTENDPNYYKTVDANGNPIPHKDLIGHSQITDVNGKPLIDWGPTQGVDGFGDWVPGTNSYENGLAIPASKMKWSPLTIDGVNTGRISGWNPSGNYNLAFNSCVSQTSRALNASGAFNIGIHPYMLHAQMYLRSIGVRPMLYSHYLTR